MTDAVQTALRSRISRLDLEMPIGLKLDVQKELEGDIEMARAVCGMFEGTGLVVRCLVEDGIVGRVLKRWRGTSAKVFGMKEGVGRGVKGGFGVRKRGREEEGDKVDVFVVVGARGSLKVVKELCGRVGMDVLVVLVNVRLDEREEGEVVELLKGGFERVYCIRNDPHPGWAGGVLFRKFPEDWVLVRKGFVGGVNVLLRSKERPSLDSIAKAFREEAEKPKNKLLENIGGLFEKKS